MSFLYWTVKTTTDYEDYREENKYVNLLICKQINRENYIGSILSNLNTSYATIYNLFGRDSGNNFY